MNLKKKRRKKYKAQAFDMIAKNSIQFKIDSAMCNYLLNVNGHAVNGKLTQVEELSLALMLYI